MIDEEVELIIRELTAWVFWLGLSGRDLGGRSFGEFLNEGGFAAGASEGVDEAGKDLGVATEVLVEVSGVDVAEGQKEAGNGELEGGLAELRGVEAVQEIESGFLVGAQVLEPVLFEDPALVMGTAVPAGEIAGGDSFGRVVEHGRDVSEGDTIANEGIELIPGGFGEAADFALGAALGAWSGRR